MTREENTLLKLNEWWNWLVSYLFIGLSTHHYSARSCRKAFSKSVTICTSSRNDNCCAQICCFVTWKAFQASGNSIPVTFESFSTAKLGSTVVPRHLKKIMLYIRPKQCLNSSHWYPSHNKPFSRLRRLITSGTYKYIKSNF